LLGVTAQAAVSPKTKGADSFPEGTLYGIDCKKKIVKKDVVKKGEKLTDILSQAGIPENRIKAGLSKSKKVFKSTQFQAGKNYCLITSAQTQKPEWYFIFEHNPVEYVVFDFREAVSVYKESKPLDISIRTVEGVIVSTLLNAFDIQNLPDELARQLAEIYAWTIDFYHFRKGDKFRIIYEEKSAGNKFMGVGRVLAARITHAGEDYYAFFYKDKYYDETGKSLQKSFLKAPLKFARVSSPFSRRRLHPILHIYRPHLGTDYAAAVGTPVLSVGDGVVETVSSTRGAGKFIRITHSPQYSSQYLHLSRYAKNIKPGTGVKQGQVIGYVGKTGMATGPHLDFRFWANGKPVNFLKQNDIKLVCLKAGDLKTFQARTVAYKTELDTKKIIRFSAELDLGPKG
jgi:murein DD-endopeptidase MepM/ murein hydrolase activator NlpD